MTGTTYKPAGEVLRSFMRSDAFFRGVRGPVGSGKSVACAVEILRRSNQQKKGADGKRHSRWAVIRNTNPQLRTTTIKTWLEWFPEDRFGKFNWSVPYTHNIEAGDLATEVIFLSLDRDEDVRKLLSLDLTGAWVNEAREVPKAVMDGVTMRVGRYPSMGTGGPTWYGVIADTNAPDDDHWWPVMAGEAPPPEFMTEEETATLIKPKDWEFYIQPAAMIEERGEGGRVVGYKVNEAAENIGNLPADYYPRIITGKAKGWIDVYVMNRLGADRDGKPVYPTFRREFHVAPGPLAYVPDVPIYIGVDFGLTPAGVIAQRMPSGRWHILREVVTSNMGAKRFAQVMKSVYAQRCPGARHFLGYGDPAGDQRAQTDEVTPFQICRAEGFGLYPAPSNDPVLRVETVEELLNRQVDGGPGILLDPSCKVLIKGFEGAYEYRRLQVSGDARHESAPSKNRYSHPHDALQYLVLGAGESKRVLGVRHASQAAQARERRNPFERMQGRKPRQVRLNRIG